MYSVVAVVDKQDVQQLKASFSIDKDYKCDRVFALYESELTKSIGAATVREIDDEVRVHIYGNLDLMLGEFLIRSVIAATKSDKIYIASKSIALEQILKPLGFCECGTNEFKATLRDINFINQCKE